MLKNFINIITSPQEAFSALKEKPSTLFPLLVIIVATALIQFVYFHNVDLDFFIDQAVEQARQLVGIPEEQLRQSMEGTNLSTQAITSAIATSIFLPLMFCLYAGYLTFVSKFTGDEIGFKRWFCLAVWTSVPLIFSSAASIGLILMSSNGMISQTQINPISLNNLIFQTDGPFQSLLSNLDIIQLWSLALLAIGHKNWTGKSLLSAFFITSTPYLLIYGIWSLFIVL